MTEDELMDAAYDHEQELRNALFIPSHRFTVTLGRPANAVGYGGWGPEYGLACGGDPATSVCHWWRDEEGDPRSYRQHEECSVLEWFSNDTADFVENGYAGPQHDGLTSGLVDIAMWGEDGFEWYYLETPQPKSGLADPRIQTLKDLIAERKPQAEDGEDSMIALLEDVLDGAIDEARDALTYDRLDWWARRIYDAQEFAAYTVETDGEIRGHDEVYAQDDPLQATLRAFMAEIGLPYPEETDPMDLADAEQDARDRIYDTPEES